jgi:hypothetical protein
MHLTEQERVNFYKEAIGQIYRSSKRGSMRGLGVDGRSKCCNADLMFRNLVMKKSKKGRAVVADVLCIKCRAYLGDSMINANNIKEKRNGV